MNIDPSLFNPLTLIGVGFAPHVEVVVEYLKSDWFLPKKAAPFAASVISVVSQVIICLLFKIPLSDAIIGSVIQTASTVFYHELTTP